MQKLVTLNVVKFLSAYWSNKDWKMRLCDSIKSMGENSKK